MGYLKMEENPGNFPQPVGIYHAKPYQQVLLPMLRTKRGHFVQLHKFCKGTLPELSLQLQYIQSQEHYKAMT